MSKQTVLQQEIERLELIVKNIEKNHDNISGDIAIAKVKYGIKVLTDLLPASEQELKEAYMAGQSSDRGEPDADDWFRNQFGEG